MKNTFRKILSLAICLVMVCGVIPFTAFNVSAMQIYVSVVSDGETLTLEAESSDSIDAVKSKIMDKTGVSADRQTLIYNDKELENGHTLADYNIPKESTIQLIINQYISGDIIELGSYPQSEITDITGLTENKDYVTVECTETATDAETGEETEVTYEKYYAYEPIEWVVLDPSAGLCVSKYVLDAKAFVSLDNVRYDEMTNDYAESYIRTRLYGTDGTGEFYTNTFTDGEKSVILQENIESSLNDKVFLLSTDEANTYFDDDSARICTPTAYAVANGASADDEYNSCQWWLRSPGEASIYDDVVRLVLGAIVSANGSVNNYGELVCNTLGVRPALYLDFESEITLDANDGTDETEKHTVSNLSSYYPDCPFTSGTKVFRGWYRDEECQEPWSGDDVVTEDMTLYAGWYETGDIIEYGTYPQSKVEDEELIAALNAAGGTWVSYGYYTGTAAEYGGYDGKMTASDYMRYKDIVYDGVKYRAVTFDSYRPYYTGCTSSVSNTDQKDNGYEPGYTYWFRYDPIEWRVLDPETGMVICSTAIDSQAYNSYMLYSGSEYYGDADCTYYASNYAESSIREWLNNDFYNTAFSDEQKANILETTLDNSSSDSSTYDATDKVYLLSYADLINSSYGFNSSYTALDTARQLKSTDYAKSQGCYAIADGSFSNWWLRSPYNSGYTCIVNYQGYCKLREEVYCTEICVVPVINLQTLKSDTAGSEITVSNGDGTHTEYDSSLTASETKTCTYTSVCTATCTAAGTTTYTCSVCGYTYSEDAAALGHSFTNYVNNSNATCTKNATETAKCDRCNVTDTREIADSALGHTSKDAVKENEVAPTCTEAGSYDSVIYCSVCGDEISRETVTVPAAGHSFTNYISDNNTACTKNATETAKCDRCDVTDTREIADSALGHTPKDAVKENETAPTCTETGSYDNVVYCSVCGDEISRETVTVPASGHSFTNYVADNNATCTKNATETAKCDNCDVTDTREIANSATGHDYDIEYVWSEDSSTDSLICTATATCKNDGTHVVTETSSAMLLSAIGASCYSEGAKTFGAKFSNSIFEPQTKTVTVPKTEHTPAEAVKENETAPTCTAAGSYDSVIYCSVCGDEISRETVAVPASGHSFTSYVSDNNATCTENATETAKCDRCDATDTREIADSALGHTPKDAVKENEVAPTCTEEGSYDSVIYCSVCNAELSRETVTVPATGHSFTSYVSDNNATCTKNGTETAKCDNCDVTDTREIENSALGHTPKDAVKENEVAPTCTEEGSYDSVIYCSVCNAELSRETVTVPAAGHVDEDGNGKCDTCGADLGGRSDLDEAVILVSASTKVNYGADVTVTATGKNIPDDCCLAIFVDGKEAARGDNESVSFDFGKITSDINYEVKVVDGNGNVQKDSSGRELAKNGGTIECKDNFFTRLLALFMRIFRGSYSVAVKPEGISSLWSLC